MTEQDEGTIGAGSASRRTVLLGAGAIGAAGLLAACGGDQPTSPPANPPAVDNTTGQAPTTAAEDIKLADIPVGGGKFLQDRHALVTQPTAGDIQAFDATCPHMGCTVRNVSGGRMTCECHFSQFSITDGSVLKGPNNGQPMTRGLRKLPVIVNGDTITVG